MRQAMRSGALLAVVSAVVFTINGCGADDESAAATLSITAAIEPAAPVVGQNSMTLTVTDDAGAVAGAQLTVDPQMPMHGHGSTEVPVVTDHGDGTYTAAPVTFQMPGHWEVTVTATRGPDTGSEAFSYEVQ